MNNNEIRKGTFTGIIILILAIVGLGITIWIGYKNSKEYYTYDKKGKYKIDSVEYHPLGSDNTMQVTPYWKIRLEGKDFFIHSYTRKEKGDSIEIIERFVVSREKSK